MNFTREPERLVIIGGGPTAAAIAPRARKAGWEVAAAPLYPGDRQPDADSRTFGELVEQATMIAVTTPASGHAAVSIMLRGLVRPDALVVLLPGQPGGALQFARVLPGTTVAEASIAPFAQVGDAVVELSEVPVATVPAEHAPCAVARLSPLFSAEPAPNTVWTALHAPDVVLRTVPVIANARGARAPGLSLQAALAGPAGDLAERLEDERQAIATALRISVPRTGAWLADTLRLPSGPLPDVLGPLAETIVPAVTEPGWLPDLAPFGLVPTVAIARWASVLTPSIDALIAMADALLHNDYALAGRTAELIGIGEPTWPLEEGAIA
jgi:hypothetical protein